MSTSNPQTDSTQGQIMVATNDDTVYCRVVGLGTMNNSISFKLFVEHLQKKGFREFVFDFSTCSGFDSTFMGILLGLALGERRVLAVNVNQPQRKLLAEVGIDRVINICEESVQIPDIPAEPLEPISVGPRARIQHILEAHENLVRLDDKNRRQFGAFLACLKEELGEDAPT